MIASFAGRHARTEEPHRARQRRDRRRTGHSARPGSIRWGTSSGWGTAARSSSMPSRVPGGRWNWNSQLWSIAYPAGTLRRITPNDASYLTAAATKDGRTLVAIRDELRASLVGGARRRQPRARVRSPGAARAAKAPSASTGPSTAASSTAAAAQGPLGYLDREERRQRAQAVDERSAACSPNCGPTAPACSSWPGGQRRRRDSLHGSRRQQCSIDRNGRTDLPREPAGIRDPPVLQYAGERHVRNVPCADRRRCARAVCSPIRPRCRRASPSAVSRPTGAGRPGPTAARTAPAWRSCRSTDRHARYKIPYTYTPGLVPRTAGRRVRRRSKTSWSGTGRPTSGASRSTARRRGP